MASDWLGESLSLRLERKSEPSRELERGLRFPDALRSSGRSRALLIALIIWPVHRAAASRLCHQPISVASHCLSFIQVNITMTQNEFKGILAVFTTCQYLYLTFCYEKIILYGKNDFVAVLVPRPTRVQKLPIHDTACFLLDSLSGPQRVMQPRSFLTSRRHCCS